MYIGRCDIYGQIEKINPNHATTFEEGLLFSDVPCKLSFSGTNTSKQKDINNNFIQSVTLFIDNELDIKSGSKIVVTQDGITSTYKCSGQPSFFMAHQEIGLLREGES